MNEWQPIKTAPKDGSRFLVWVRGFGTYEIAVAWHDPADPDVWQVQNLPGLGVRRDFLDAYRGHQVSWMPLPASTLGSD